ncbi:serine/threonine-protein kinase phg2-like [Drosophila albomicans]|uniref:Serine/threonine-protein kinase phg2-like n=1 Tax=Drosophila albomicans TaxID=7291 RepID=A0A9C6SZL3_DROAB|nr:serine/threonine-protein kinase phg2-like [Drosophila albomicans]
MLSVMATTTQEVMDVEMSTTNPSPLQGSVNVITILSTSNNNSNNNNNNNNNSALTNNNSNSNINNNSDNCNIIPSESPEAAAAGAAAGGGGGGGAAAGEHSFVAIPLLERRRRSRSHSRCHIAPLAPIICIQNGAHPEDLTQLSRSVSCFVRFRRSFAKLFAKIMGSNNPSEADRYDYYDYELRIVQLECRLKTQLNLQIEVEAKAKRIEN